MDSLTRVNNKCAASGIGMTLGIGILLATFGGMTYQALVSFKSMTWGEIKTQRRGKSISLDGIIKDVQDRLGAICQDDIDEPFELHLTGRCRIWEIRDSRVLRVLWYDPEHRVCPSELRHT